MDIYLKPIQQHERMIVHRLFQFYLYDIAKFTQWPFSDKGDFHHAPETVDAYFSNENHFPNFIMSGNEIVGFSLVRHYPQDEQLIDMGQFYVSAVHAEKGIGKAAFRKTVKTYPGAWQVRALKSNDRANRFWASIISEISSGSYEQFDASYSDMEMTFYKFEYIPDA